MNEIFLHVLCLLCIHGAVVSAGYFRTLDTNGKWCDHPRLETTVSPRSESACQRWCSENNYRYCMWDHGRADGFCMASYFCDQQILPSDNRRYRVTESLDYVGTLQPWIPEEDTPGYWCNHGRIETSVSSERDCLKWCDLNKRQYCMWDYARADGFCMASHSCVQKTLASDDRRYRVWRNANFLSYTSPWMIYADNGKWCVHPRDETTVSMRSEDACLRWCSSKERSYCMWDYGRGDGFCMASDACSERRMAGDDRRYRVWINEKAAGEIVAPSVIEPGICNVVPQGHDELRRRRTRSADSDRRAILNRIRLEAVERSRGASGERYQFGAMEIGNSVSATAYHPRYEFPGSAPYHSEEILLHVARERLLENNGNIHIVFGNCQPVIYLWTEHSPCMLCTSWLTMFAEEFPGIRVVVGFNRWLIDNLVGLRQLLGELDQPDNLELYQYTVDANNHLSGGSEI